MLMKRAKLLSVLTTLEMPVMVIQTKKQQQKLGQSRRQKLLLVTTGTSETGCHRWLPERVNVCVNAERVTQA